MHRLGAVALAVIALAGCGAQKHRTASSPKPTRATGTVPILSVTRPGQPATASDAAIRRLIDHGCRAVIVIGSRAICKGSPSALAEAERALGVSLK
jgi:hypothetical protein